MVALSSILDEEDDLFDSLGHRAAIAGAIQKRRAAAAGAFLAQQRPREPERQASGPQGKKHKDATPFSWAEHSAIYSAGCGTASTRCWPLPSASAIRS